MHSRTYFHSLWFAKTPIKLLNNRVDPASLSWLDSLIDISVEDSACFRLRIEIHSQDWQGTWQRAEDSRYLGIAYSCSHQKGQWIVGYWRQLVQVWDLGLIKTALSNKREPKLLSLSRQNNHENNSLVRVELPRFPPLERFPSFLLTQSGTLVWGSRERPLLFNHRPVLLAGTSWKSHWFFLRQWRWELVYGPGRSGIRGWTQEEDEQPDQHEFLPEADAGPKHPRQFSTQPWDDEPVRQSFAHGKVWVD